MRNKSFTLVELIVVIAIVAILSAIIVPNAFKAVEKAKIAKASVDFKTIKNACYSLYADTGRWPIYVPYSGMTISSSAVLLNPSWAGWDGHYLEKNPEPHPWGGIYAFVFQDWGGGVNAYELILSFNDNCHPHPANPSADCDVPSSAMEKVENIVDNGNLRHRNFNNQSKGE